MEFFRIHKTIPFMHYSHILNAISLLSVIVAVFWIFYHGLALSIEFTGGTQVCGAVSGSCSRRNRSANRSKANSVLSSRAELRYGTRHHDSSSDEGGRNVRSDGRGTSEGASGNRSRRQMLNTRVRGSAGR